MNTEWFSHIDLQFIYVLLSAVVAVLIWFEGQMLKKTDGKLPKSSLFHSISLLETIWTLVCIAAYYFMELDPLALAVPAAYGIYTIAGWVYGSRLISKKGLPTNPKDLVVPLRYVAFSQSFALVFFLLCVFVLASPWLLPAPPTT